MLSLSNYVSAKYIENPESQPKYFSDRVLIAGGVDVIIGILFGRSIVQAAHTAAITIGRGIIKVTVIVISALTSATAWKVMGAALILLAGGIICFAFYRAFNQYIDDAKRANLERKEQEYTGKRRAISDRLSGFISQYVRRGESPNLEKLQELCDHLQEFYKTVYVQELSPNFSEDNHTLDYYLPPPQVYCFDTAGNQKIHFISVTPDGSREQVKAFIKCFPSPDKIEGVARTVNWNGPANQFTTTHELHQVAGVYFRFKSSRS